MVLADVPFDLNAFLTKGFPSLSLDGGLFYRWPIGIRFELAGEADSLSERLTQATDRASALYAALFETDELCVVLSQNWLDDTPTQSPRYLTPLFALAAAEGVGLRNPNGLMEVPAAGDSGAYVLSWVEQLSRGFKFRKIFRGIANQDHGVEPSIGGRVYFLNPRTQVIMHMYDDRGLDIVATDKRSITTLYESFSTWILDYDRVRIDELFKSTGTL